MFRHKEWVLLFCAVLACPVLIMAQESTDSAKKAAGDAAAKSEATGDTAAGEKKDPPPAQPGAASPSPATDAAAANSPGDADAKAADAPPPPQATGGGAAEPAMSGGSYSVRLRDLEGRVNRLKEQIFRSKARLSLLAETVLDRKIAGSRLNVVFRNEMGGSFKLVKAMFLLDGGPVFNKTDESGSLAERELIDLFDGPIVPGDHTVSVILNYRGHGYGIFSYLKGYAFKTKSSRTFTVAEGKAVTLEVVGYEKGGATTPLEERPSIRYIKNVADYEASKTIERTEQDGGEK